MPQPQRGSYLEMREERKSESDGARSPPTNPAWSAPPPPPPPAAWGRSVARARGATVDGDDAKVDVVFRKRKLGLDLRYDHSRGTAVLAEAPDHRAQLRAGDALLALDGEAVVIDSEEAFQALFFRLADGPRPLRLTFARRAPQRSRVASVAGVDYEAPAFYELDVAGGRLQGKDGKDACVAFRGGQVVVRGALSRERRRSVLAVRSAEGLPGCEAGDSFLGLDGALALPRADARDVWGALDAALAGSQASKAAFCRGSAGDALYTVKLPAAEIEDDDDWDDHPGRRRSSFSALRRSSFLSRDLPDSATEAWGVSVAADGGFLRVTTLDEGGLAKAAAVRLGDVVVALNGNSVIGLGILDFADVADGAVRSALKVGRAFVSATFANDRVVPAALLGVAPPSFAPAVPAPPPRSRGAPPVAPPIAVDDGLPAAARPPKRVSTGSRRVSSGRFDQDRASWSGLSASEKRRLAQLRRLLRAGVGAEWHQTVGDGACRRRPVLLREFGDFEGFAVEPLRSKPIVVLFDALASVEMPFNSRYGVDDATLAASFTVTFGHADDDRPVTCDFSTASAAVAYMLADGVELARRIALTSPPVDRTGGARQRSAVSLSVDEGRSSLPARESASGAAAALSAVGRSAPFFLMDGDAPQRRWWQNLRKGVVVEVYYAEDTYAVKTPVGDVDVAETAFSEGTYCRCVVVRRMRAGRAEGKHWYVLKYKDGPYDCDAPRGAKRRGLPKGTRFVGVPRDCMVLTYENQKLYLPWMLALITLAQILFFVQFADQRYGSVREVGPSGPTVGPSTLWFRLTGPFPECFDARFQYWRLFTYQIVHQGYYHLACNCVMQCVFGASVEMVHGHRMILLVYQFGVALGALTCAFTDIHRAVVGASGGVYTLIGLHFADVLLNFRAMNDHARRATRALLCTAVPALDIFIYVFLYADDTTSYSAHAGGGAAGFLLGLALLDPVAEMKLHTYGVRPLAALALLAYFLFAFGWQQSKYPPEYLYNGRPWRRSSWGKEDLAASCCWQLQDCADIDERDYDYFNCDDDKDLTITIASDDLALDVVLQTCDALKDALATALSLEHLIPDDDLRR